ncbi:MAG: hypothetical protein OEM62_11200 [Acidobacteriota bacterium]|nr:hypothetical protein [Acidobacteriota bacterium]
MRETIIFQTVQRELSRTKATGNLVVAGDPGFLRSSDECVRAFPLDDQIQLARTLLYCCE